MSQESLPLCSSLCQVCSHDTSTHKDAVRIIRHVKGEDDELLAILCMRCWARGTLWAAKHALAVEKAIGSLPDGAIIVSP